MEQCSKEARKIPSYHPLGILEAADHGEGVCKVYNKIVRGDQESFRKNLLNPSLPNRETKVGRVERYNLFLILLFQLIILFTYLLCY